MSTTKLVHLTTPLDPDVLLPLRMTTTEELGRPFRYDLELLSHDPAIQGETLLGKTMSVSVDLPDGKTRWFNGYVTRFAYSGRTGRWVRYHATLRPWLWFLTRAQDCRIFGNGSEGNAKLVTEIAKAVFRKHGFSDFEEKLQASYLPRTYCVQYRETDFDFVSRLLEEEGIYYAFRHSEGVHMLEMYDGPGSHKTAEAYDEVPFISASADSLQREDHIYQWLLQQEVQPGEHVHRDFEFVTPQVDLTASAAASRSHPYGTLQIYDPPGGYVEPYEVASGDGSDQDAQDRGRAYAKLRLEEMQARFETVDGMSNAVGLAVGELFTLKEHPRDDQNRDWLVVSTRHELAVAGYEGLEKEVKESVYRCAFTAMPSDVPFRPARTTPRPLITGPQTATVTGKSGEEIWTDKHGRVKVHFHWDRLNEEDENSSCWIRVAQVWAGQNWGGVHIPRMGQEVIVEFLEGDPDRPIVTGRVYNGRQTHPYGLPELATQSGIKSRSSKGGGPANFNELRFEDKKGSEQVYLHAEKDKQEVVENDNTESVGHDEALTVDHNRTKKVGVDEFETIGSNKTIEVGVDHEEQIGKNMTLKVGVNRSETIGSNQTLVVGSNMDTTVASNSSLSVGTAETITVGVNRAVTVGAACELVVGAAYSVTVGANASENVGANKSVQVGNDHSLSVGKNFDATAGESGSVTAAKNLVLKAKKIALEADEEISIKTGSAEMLLKKDGTITISGKDVTVKGSGKISVKASSDVTIKGSKVTQN